MTKLTPEEHSKIIKKMEEQREEFFKKWQEKKKKSLLQLMKEDISNISFKSILLDFLSPFKNFLKLASEVSAEQKKVAEKDKEYQAQQLQRETRVIEIKPANEEQVDSEISLEGQLSYA